MTTKSNVQQSLRKLLRPVSIAVIGATDTAGKVGAVITKNLLDGGFVGRVICVNPRRPEAFGRKCVASLADEDGDVDCAIVAVPAELVATVIRQSASKCANFVVISAGFAEASEAGKKREKELLALAGKLNLTIIGPNCLGFIIPSLNLNASFAGGQVRAGSVALSSQSGAVAVALMDTWAAGARGFSGVVSLGNKMQIDEVDIIRFFADDDNTRVIGAYSESIGNGEEWMETVAQVVAQKPVVMLKSGRSDIASSAIALHTGAMVSSDDVVDAMCRRTGVWRADSFREFAHLLEFGDIYGMVNLGGDVAIVTNAGGFGVLTTDEVAQSSLSMAKFGAVTTQMLEENLPPAASSANPIDLLGDAGVDRYDVALSTIGDDANVTAVVVIVTPQEQTPLMDIARLLVAMRAKLTQPLLVAFVGGAKIADAVAYLRRNNVMIVPAPADAVKVLSHIYQAQSDKYIAQFVPEPKLAQAGHIVSARARQEERGSLYYHEVGELAAAFDIPLSKAWRMDYHNPREVQFPCVVKVDAPKILHKTDSGGVLLNITTPIELVSAVDSMHSKFGAVRVIAQPMVKSGMEIIIGAVRDGVAGVIVMVGYGGIYAEQIDMTLSLSAPVTAKYVSQALTKSRLGFLWQVTRGLAPYDLAAVAQIVTAVGDMMLTHSWISAIDINPLIIYNDETPAVVVDMKVMVASENL